MLSTLEKYANRNPKHLASHDGQVIGRGKYKNVMKGSFYPGKVLAATKFLNTGATFSDSCFLDDIRSAEAALPYVAGFVEYIDSSTVYRGRVSIKLNVPAVWEEVRGASIGQRCLVEPFIENFQKFNSNSGAADVTAAVAQALSHYSYHASDGTELLCDLQGGRIGESYVLSDVAMMSMGRKYGNTDLGAIGIENWLHSHQCTQFCSSGWKKWSGAKCLIVPVFSTTMTLDLPSMPGAGRVAWGQEFVRICPSKIYFTQDSIKDRFQDGHTLLETALQIARQEVGKRDIPMISVIRCSNRQLFAVDNRRLAVFRLLEMCDRVGTIKVEVVPVARWADEWRRKLTSTNGGAAITIRGYGGKQVGRNQVETRFPGLDQIKSARPRSRAEIMADAQFSIFLRSFNDEE